SLFTTFSASGGLYRTYSFTDRPSYENMTNTGTEPTDIIRGVYTPRPTIAYGSHGRIGTATHLPQLRLVVQLTADFQLMNYAVAQWQDMVPIGYVTRDLTRHAFSEQDRDSPEYRRLAEFPRIKYERTNDERNLVTANFHMAVAKEIGKRLR